MSRPAFSILAAVVTVLGLILVVAASRVASRLPEPGRRALATGLLAVYGIVPRVHPAAWPAIDGVITVGSHGVR